MSRRARTGRVPVLVALLLLPLLAACRGGGGSGARVEVREAGVEPTVATAAATAAATTAPVSTAPSLAGLLGPRSNALPQPAGPPPAEPVRLSIPSIALRGAVVRPTGVEPNGAMEIPPAKEVGWYRFGAVPGDTGAAVLAAHIAYNGRNGAFRRLVDVELGARVEVALADGTTRAFAVSGIRQYRKSELPTEAIFSREGPPRLVLITCGGDFLPSERSYQDNIVAFADPV